MKRILTTAIAMFAAVIFAAGASAQSLTVTNSYANCRSKAGANNAYLGRVYQGESYAILGSAKAPNGRLWYKIRKNGVDCFVCSSFVRVVPDTNKAAKTPQSANKRLLGRYYITGYCAACNTPRNSRITASGKTATVGRTVAMKGLPFGTRVYIEGIGERIVEDRGVGTGKVDVFCANCAAERKITGYRNVYIIEQERNKSSWE